MQQVEAVGLTDCDAQMSDIEPFDGGHERHDIPFAEGGEGCNRLFRAIVHGVMLIAEFDGAYAVHDLGVAFERGIAVGMMAHEAELHDTLGQGGLG